MLCAGLIAFSAAASAGDLAQPVLPGYPAPVYPGYAAALPPHEVVTIVRSARLQPLHRPMRHGPTYVLRAVDPAGQEVRVTVDARLGRIVQVVPVLGPRYAVLPPPYGRPPGLIPMIPDGVPPPGVDGSPMTGPGLGVPPPAPGRAPAAAAAPPAAAPASPPLPRPRPKLAQSPAANPAPGPAPQAAPSPSATPQAATSQAATSQGEAKETQETTGAVVPPASPAPAPVEQHE
jgi:hypothetical protein